MVKINGNAVRPGHVLEYEGKLWSVSKVQHTQPGKGGAYMQVEMKCLTDQTKMTPRFRSSEQVERVHLEETPYQYLYMEGDDLVLMDQTTYEQKQVSKDLAGGAMVFLQDGMEVRLCSYEDKPLSLSLPDTVIMTIEEAEPVVKGQTASSSFKPARLENGERIMVPPHIESGMRVVVNTADGTYVERAKE